MLCNKIAEEASRFDFLLESERLSETEKKLYVYCPWDVTSRRQAEGDRIKLAIPNQEIRKIFEDQILKWFHDSVREDGATLNAFCEAFRNGDSAKVQEQFRAYLKKTISWVISSNRESGDGCSVMLAEDHE